MAVLNVRPGTVIVGDNLDVMQGINDECVDLIATDPPFNSKQDYKSPLGSQAAGAFFKDSWTWDDVDYVRFDALKEHYPEIKHVVNATMATHGKGSAAYAVMMGTRIAEMHRILKPTGSLYMHCNQDANFMLRYLLDTVFGADNFRSELVWHYRNKLRDKRKRRWQMGTDTIFHYTKTDDYAWNPQYEKRDKPVKYARIQKVNGKKMTVKDAQGKVVYMESHEKLRDNVLAFGMLTNGREYVKFKTQKPVALYQCIIAASSNKGDVVLDPFCGCGTTLIAAERLGRKWVGVDMGIKATELVEERLKAETAMGSMVPGQKPRTYRHIHTDEGGNLVEPLERTDIRIAG